MFAPRGCNTAIHNFMTSNIYTVIASGSEAIQTRAAETRSPDLLRWRPGLLRSARNDGPSAGAKTTITYPCTQSTSRRERRHPKASNSLKTEPPTLDPLENRISRKWTYQANIFRDLFVKNGGVAFNFSPFKIRS